jgi:hypothetical protein
MAPPTLYDEPPRPGVMTPGAPGAPFEIGLRGLLWSIAAVLAAIEVCVEFALA